MRSLPSGLPVASFGIATNRVFKDKNGAKKEDVQFHNIVVFGKQAEIAKQYLAKGASVFIEGRIQTRNWNAQDGSKHSKTEIIAERFQMGPRRGATGAGRDFNSESQKRPAQNNKTEQIETIEYPEEEVNADDIPF